MAKKEKALYDENGVWVEEKNRIKGAIRRTFRLSPQMKEVRLKARVELPPAPKKDGTPGKKPQVRYRCAGCRELFSDKYTQVDHIKTTVPLWQSEKNMSYDELVRGIFCSTNNLQVLCSTPLKLNGGKPSCHKIKTDKENFIRNFLKTKTWKTEPELLSLIKSADKLFQEYLEERDRKLREKQERKKVKSSRVKTK